MAEQQHPYPKPQQQPQQQQGAVGVRAEPVFIRDPSALESLSSVLTGVSSYVANTLPTSFSMPSRGFSSSPSAPAMNANTANPYYYPAAQGSTNPLLGGHQDNVCILTNGDVVLFSAFDWIDSGSITKSRTSRRFCLLLGYADGFQIWDITHPDNIHEIVSIRNSETEVSFLKVLPSPRVTPGKVDQFEQYRPLVAIISSTSTEDRTSAPKRLQIYSLAKQQVIKALDFGEGPDYDISALDVNERAIVVALTAPGESTRLFLLSQFTLHSLHQKQTVLNDAAYPGVFDLGTRLLAYVTTSEAPTDSTDSKYGEHDAEGGTGYQDLAKGVAKEVFGGVKLLGGFAHQTLSSYWSGNSGAGSTASTSPPVQSGINRSPHRHTRRASASVDHPDRTTAHNHHRRRHDDNSPHKREAVGTVIVRDISLPNMPIVAHFKPHDHPITGCKFSPSGRLLLTVSRHGNVFHIHEVRPNMGPGSRHVYKLARGITHASVEDIVFNEDETWVAVTTSRGTTHLYAINPFGGTPDVGAHMYTGVVNWTATAIEYPTGLNALCRIKQRHHVPDVILSEASNPDGAEPQMLSTSEKRRSALRRQNSQDSLSSAGTGTSDQSQGYLSRLQQHHGAAGGGKQRAMIAAYFLPSTTVFASDPGNIALSPGEYDGGTDGPFGSEGGHYLRSDSPSSHLPQAHSSTLLINRSKAPPVSTAARLQSKASSLWQTLSPPAAAVVQHAAHGLASLPGLVVETSRRGPVVAARNRTMSWTGSHNQGPPKQHSSSRDARGEGASSGTHGRSADTQKNGIANGSDVPLAVQQQLATQSALSEPERSPSFADIYVFNPLGMLTLHRCWVSSVRTKKTYNGRVVETSDLVLAPEDVAEWSLNRSGDWAQVRRSLAPLAGQRALQQGRPKKAVQSNAGSRWLAQAEISTYDSGIHSGWKGQYPILNQTLAAHGAHGSTVTLTQPQHLLWKSHQFVFQTYVGPLESIQRDFAAGRLPETKTVNLRRGIDIVAGKDARPVEATSTGTQSKPYISGVPVSADGGGVRGHGRVESIDGDTEGLSQHLSHAMDSFLHRHSTSPINQARMSPSVGSVSPSSYRAQTLSFDEAYLISSGNGSASPRTHFFGSSNHPPHFVQHTFLSTPPAETAPKGRASVISGTSPASASSTIQGMTAYAGTLSSSFSPQISSYGDSGILGLNGGMNSGSSAPVHPLNRSTPHHEQADGFNSSSIALGQSATAQSTDSPMAQSGLMMFSPDGDNEVDMPGSASIFIGANASARHTTNHRSSAEDSKRLSEVNGLHRNSKGSDSVSSGSTLPQGGVFLLDDDDFYAPTIDDDHKVTDVMSNGRYGSVPGRDRSAIANGTSNRAVTVEYLERDIGDIEDDFDEESLV